MDFRGRLEAALGPLTTQLRRVLLRLPTLSVLNNYQLRIDAVQTDKSSLPDGFIHKWRYVWGLALAGPFVPGTDAAQSDFHMVDKLVEDIFDLYALGAIYHDTRPKASKTEFLARLGLVLKVREPEFLAFPEQIKELARTRFEPFDKLYLAPTLHLQFKELTAWLDALIHLVEERLNAFVRDLRDIARDLEPIRNRFERREVSLAEARALARSLKIQDRLASNAALGESAHVMSGGELRGNLTEAATAALIRLFSITPGEANARYVFPHDPNLIDGKFLVPLPDGRFYFLDPASSYHALIKSLERELLDNSGFHSRYWQNRGRATERWVRGALKSPLAGAEFFSNYYLRKGGDEKDLLVRYKDVLILVESKNTKIRSFKGSATDLLNFQDDFEHSIQYGFDQAAAVKERIFRNDDTTFFDKKGRPYFRVRKADVRSVYILCVTNTPRGPFGTDLSYQLKKPETEPFPLALNLLDLDTICKHIRDPQRFIAYLDARQKLHGRASTGDELNYAGYFLKRGNLDLEDGSFVTDDFSAVFDRQWFREKGLAIDEPDGPPVKMTMIRHENRVTIESSSGVRESFEIPSELIDNLGPRRRIHMKGAERNNPCPCGSGRKLKHCCGRD